MDATDGQSQTKCTRVAASRMQIPADIINVTCDWRPLGYNLHATGGQKNYLNKKM